MHLPTVPTDLLPALALTFLAVACGASAAGSSNADGGAGLSPGPDGGGLGDDAAAGGDATSGGDSSAPKGDAGARGDASQGPADAAPDTSVAGYTLTWSDEFNGADGSPPDPAKWTYDVGGSGWGNQELEYYTSALANSHQQGGHLVITATPDGASALQCSYGACAYTSARLKTEGLFAQQYGRFEARAQMPFGQGLWPAIWMLGANIGAVGWPACGEIDFLETIGTDISNNHGSLHAPSYDPTATYPLPGAQKYSDAFHTFAVEWDPGEVRFYVDDQLYETRDQSGVGAGTWEFDQPFFLIINVAVGGKWPGSPDGTTSFPQTLEVDWVRVYKRSGADL